MQTHACLLFGTEHPAAQQAFFFFNSHMHGTLARENVVEQRAYQSKHVFLYVIHGVVVDDGWLLHLAGRRHVIACF
jgi:hypothetical protein